MSAMGDLAAAFLPPEAGGPGPERIAAATRMLTARMPRLQRRALAGFLLSLEAAALGRHGRTLGRIEVDQRARLLAAIAASGAAGAGVVEALKTLVLLAAGGDEFAAEITETGARHPLSHPDPPLVLVDASELDESKRWDAIVIGSGAGGAFAARALARAGHQVLIVEEGERWDSARIRSAHPLDRFASLYREAGTTVALGRPPIVLPQGRAVGGTTVINSGTCYRPPPGVIARWRDHHGLELAGERLDERLADVEKTLAVGPVPLDVMGRNGRIALEGAKRLGWRADPLVRNAPGCRGACQCAIGCPNNAKAGVHMNALPQACAAGAQIAAGTRVERILIDNGSGSGVRARVAGGRALDLHSRQVIVAAGAIATPPLLRRSGLAAHPRVGRGLSIHPALGATGRFAEPVLAWRGVLQSAGIEELHERRGILLEATSSPPGMGSITMPGIGAELVERIAGASHLASLGAMIADAPSGRVLGTRRPVVVYRLARNDAGRLVEALGAIARVLLAAGAEEVELGGGAKTIRDTSDVGPALAQIDARSLHVAAFHPTGTVAAGSNPACHPADPNGALRGVGSVWIADASIIPSCPGVNPQVSIMALAAGVGDDAAAA